MSELDHDARALIAHARRTERPSPEDRARVRARLEPVWAAYRAQQNGAGAEHAALGKVHGVWGRASAWINPVLLSTLLLWGPEAARELSSPVDRAPEAASSPAETLAGDLADRAVPPPLAASATTVEHGAVDPAPARPIARVLGSPDREPTPALSSPPPRAAADGRARAGRRDLAAHVPTGPAQRSVVSVPQADARVASRAPTERAPLDAALDRRADRAAAEIASSARASQTPDGRSGTGERVGPREVGPVQRDPGFAPQAIDDELGWLAAAQQALREGRAQQALRLVQEHAFRFPRGALAPERIAVQALALCALDRRSAARAVLADLARTAPGSPLLQGVQRKCGDGL